MKKYGFKILNGAAVFAIWTLVWEIISLFVKNELIFPGPVSVAKKLAELIVTANLWLSLLKSFGGIFLGYLIANAAGIIFGALSFKWKIFRKLFEPMVALIKATPVASFIVVVLIVLGREETPIFISFLMVFPIIFHSILAGLGTYDKNLLEVANVYNASTFLIIRHVYVPAVFPGYIGAVRTGLGLAWKAGIAAEVLCNTRNTIGGAIYDSKVYLEIPELFAWTAIVVVISILIEKLTVLFLNKIIK